MMNNKKNNVSRQCGGRRLFAIGLLSAVLFAAYGNHQKVQSDGGDDVSTMKMLVNEWNNAHNSKDEGSFSNLFADKVLFYGTSMDRNSCIQSKLSLFKKHPDFHQQIYGEIQLDTLSDEEIRCNFVKKATLNQKSEDYPSYLVLHKEMSNWKIVVEGDLVTDKNLCKKQKNYYYDSKISNIYGVIKQEMRYGPPGYGETPEQDKKLTIAIIYLNHPINVISNEAGEEGNLDTTVKNVKSIQLALYKIKNKDIKDYLNKPVMLTGTFFSAITGYHYTPVLMDVTEITLF